MVLTHVAHTNPQVKPFQVQHPQLAKLLTIKSLLLLCSDASIPLPG